MKIVKSEEKIQAKKIEVLKKFIEFIKPFENDKRLTKLKDKIKPLRNKVARHLTCNLQKTNFNFEIYRDYFNLYMDIFYIENVETTKELTEKELKDGTKIQIPRMEYTGERINVMKIELKGETVKDMIDACNEEIRRLESTLGKKHNIYDGMICKGILENFEGKEFTEMEFKAFKSVMANKLREIAEHIEKEITPENIDGLRYGIGE